MYDTNVNISLFINITYMYITDFKISLSINITYIFFHVYV